MRQRDRNKKRRAERQEEAQFRAARYDALTLSGRLVMTTTRPGRSERERERLKAAIEAGSIGGVRLA